MLQENATTFAANEVWHKRSLLMSVEQLNDAQHLNTPMQEIISVVDTDNVQTQTAGNTANEEDVNETVSKQSVKEEKTVVITGKQLLQMKVIEMPWLLEPFFPQTGISILAGSSDAGKSTFARQLCIGIVLKEKEVFGFKLNSIHHSVIYVSYEDDRNAIALFLNLQNIKKAKEEEFEGLRFMFETHKLLKKLDAELTRKKADLVIIDTLSDNFNGTDFHSSPSVKKYFKRFKNITRNCSSVDFINRR